MFYIGIILSNIPVINAYMYLLYDNDAVNFDELMFKLDRIAHDFEKTKK